MATALGALLSGRREAARIINMTTPGHEGMNAPPTHHYTMIRKTSPGEDTPL